MSDLFLILKRGLYYRPDSAGYTGLKDDAGRYSRAEADRITHPNGPEGPRDGMTFIAEGAAPERSDGCFQEVKMQHMAVKDRRVRA